MLTKPMRSAAAQVTKSECSGAAVKRITADFSEDAYNVLDDLSKSLDVRSKADVLRKALGLLNFVVRQQREGWTLIVEKDGMRKEIVTL